jgi:myo-inositol-1(or 4)-monophosphatase
MIPTLTDLENLARGAGEILRVGYQPRPGFGPAMRVDYKGEIDLVTEVDHESEAYILGEIERRFPQDSIASEESGVNLKSGGGTWYVDPIDGTVNFAHGLPIFTVSIAYAAGGQVQLGVVYDPLLDECFSAALGQGASLNGQPIRVSNTLELDRALLGTGFPYDIRTHPRNNLDNYSRFSLLSQAMRHMGSAARDLCYVAAGRLDGFWELRLKTFDVAAGSLIAREAGATVTKVDGAPDLLAAPVSILAANPIIYSQLFENLLLFSVNAHLQPPADP